MWVSAPFEDHTVRTGSQTPCTARSTASKVPRVANLSASLFKCRLTATHLQAQFCSSVCISGASRTSHTPGVRTFPFAAAILRMGRLSPMTVMESGCCRINAANASAARNPNASAFMLHPIAGTERVACAMHRLLPSSCMGPQSAAPAPTARGPSGSSEDLGELCRAPPSKDTWKSASGSSGMLRRCGGGLLHNTSPLLMNRQAFKANNHEPQPWHLTHCQQRCQPAPHPSAGCPEGLQLGRARLQGVRRPLVSRRGFPPGYRLWLST